MILLGYEWQGEVIVSEDVFAFFVPSKSLWACVLLQRVLLYLVQVPL